MLKTERAIRKSKIANRKYLTVFWRFLGCGRTNSVNSGISQPIFSSIISRSAMSAMPMLAGTSTSGRLDAAAAGVELAHPARDEVHQHVGIADFLGGFFAKFSVHYVH